MWDSPVILSRRSRQTRFKCDWSSDVCSSDRTILRAASLNDAGVWSKEAARKIAEAAFCRGVETATQVRFHEAGTVSTRVEHDQVWIVELPSHFIDNELARLGQLA